MARFEPVRPNQQRQRDREHRHQHQFEEHGDAGGEARAKHARQLQAGPGDQQADRQRGAAERVGDLMPDARQRQMQDIEHKANDAGPDQGIAHHGHHDGADRLLFGGGVMRQHGNAEDVDQRDDRDHRHRGQRQPGVAVEIDGDRERHIGLPAGGALENRGEGRPVDRAARQQRSQARGIAATSAAATSSSAPPTPATGTVLRSALTRVWTSSTGNST